MFFRDEYWFLSNFYASEIPLLFDGTLYRMPTVENAFQAGKVFCSNLSTSERHEAFAKFAGAKPGESKGLGRTLPIDLGKWSAASESVMLSSLKQKFEPGSQLASRLLATGTQELVEDNDHGDRLWGRVNNEGTNKLGVLLMQVRADLKAAKA